MLFSVFKTLILTFFIFLNCCIVDSRGKSLSEFREKNEIELQSRNLQKRVIEESVSIVNTGPSYLPKCEPGCEIDYSSKPSPSCKCVGTDKCDSINCQNGGMCKVIENEPVCECSEEYKGYFCETHKCDYLLCENNGTCKVEQGQAKCECLEDYTGKNCQYLPEATCSRHRKNCQETAGNCISVKEEIQCECSHPSATYEQDLGCIVSDLACITNNEKCLETGGTCIPTRDREIICRCPKEAEYYDGKGCIVFNPCENGPCLNEGICIAQGKEFRCVCKEYFFGKTCSEIKCSGYVKNCEETGGYCTFDANNKLQCNCVSEDEDNHPFYVNDTGCQVANDDCWGTCVRTGGFCISTKDREIICQCPEETEYLDGFGCVVQKDMCSRYFKKCEETDGHCIFDENKELRCECGGNIAQEYHNDTGCTAKLIINVCRLEPPFCTDTGGFCIEDNGTPICVCPKGFNYRNGCQNACNKTICLNGGLCHADGDSFECVCEKPFTGKYCEMDFSGSQNNIIFYVVIGVLLCIIFILIASIVCCIKRNK